jgi:hypothetical protein
MDPRKLYFAAGLLAAGIPVAVLESIPEAEAKPVDYTAEVEIFLGAGAASTFETFLDAQFCPEVDAAFALPANTCDIDLIKSRGPNLGVQWVDSNGDSVADAWRMYAHPKLPGNFVAD